MTTFIAIFMLACCFPVLPILYIMTRNLAKPKKNLILSVTLPQEAREDKDVLDICRRFKRSLDITMVILLFSLSGYFFIGYISSTLTYLMTWLLASIVGPFIPYTVYHRQLKRMKKERGWVNPAAGQLFMDTRVSPQLQKPLNPWLFLPPAAVSLIPFIYELYAQTDILFLITYGINAAIVPLFYILYRLHYRQRAEVIDEKTSLSVALTRTRRYNWSKAWIALSWFTGAFNLFFWIFIFNIVGMVVSTAVFLVVVLFAVINAEFSTRRTQEDLTRESGVELYLDDDDYWLNGMFYYNPNDNHVLINNRFGINMTMNLAKPAGMAVMAFSAVILLAMPLIGVFMIPLEMTPVSIEMTDKALEARHTSLVYSIEWRDIQSAELLDSVDGAGKVNGTNMNTVYKGKFILPGIGFCQMNLNPEAPPYILLKTESSTYIIGAGEAEQTVYMYNQIKKIIPAPPM